MSSVNPNLFPIVVNPFVALKIQERFLSQSVNEVKLMWRPNLTANILYYDIKAGDTLLARIPGDGPCVFFDRCHVCDGNYTITATASNGNTSGPVPARVVR